MGVEQEPTALGERLYTKAQIIKGAGIPNNPTARGKLERQINRDINIAPQTDSEGHDAFSQIDHDRIVEFLKGLGEENSSLRADLELAILPDSSQITAEKNFTYKKSQKS